VLEWIGRVNRFLKKFRKKFRRRNAHALARARAAYSKGIWIASARQKQGGGAKARGHCKDRERSPFRYLSKKILINQVITLITL